MNKNTVPGQQPDGHLGCSHQYAGHDHRSMGVAEVFRSRMDADVLTSQQMSRCVRASRPRSSDCVRDLSEQLNMNCPVREHQVRILEPDLRRQHRRQRAVSRVDIAAPSAHRATAAAHHQEEQPTCSFSAPRCWRLRWRVVSAQSRQFSSRRCVGSRTAPWRSVE